MASELIIGKLQKHKFMSICDHVLFGIAEKSEITFMIFTFWTYLFRCLHKLQYGECYK